MTFRQFLRLPALAAIGAIVFLAPLAARSSAQSPEVASQPVDINILDREIARAVQVAPNLHGAWLYVQRAAADEPDSPGKLVFRRVLDRSRAAAQQTELARLIAAWAPQGGYEVLAEQDLLLPFSQLMAELQLAVETEPRLGGCMVSGGYYEADKSEPGKLNLVLQGRIAKEGQDVEIEALCGRIMRAHPAWVKLAGDQAAADAADFIPLLITPNSAELKVVEPSEANGRWFYGVGLRHFWRGDYHRAARSFRQAVLESPGKLQYCYWWILSDLAVGDQPLARRRMLTAVQRFRDSDFDRQSPDYVAVVRSLERVQGPLRRQLLKLETQALLLDSRAGND